MSPAFEPPTRRDAVRLLVIDPRTGSIADRPFIEFADLFGPGDLLVVNDAATLPASLPGFTRAGRRVEARLVQPVGPGEWEAVLFGAGDWRTRTEDRPAPPRVHVGDRLSFGELRADVVALSELSPRLVQLRFDREGEAFLEALYARARPIQYSHGRMRCSSPG